MYIEKIAYTDYNGITQTGEFMFNLSKPEVVKLQASYPGGVEVYLKAITDPPDAKAIVDFVENLILMSYGERSMDGRRFVKSTEMREAFQQTDAYSEIFMKLVQDPDHLAEFVNGIIPKVPQA